MKRETAKDVASALCRIALVAGTRPNLVKLGPLAELLGKQPWCAPSVLFLEQHTDASLSDEIMEDVGLDQSGMHRIQLSSDDTSLRIGEMISASSTWLSVHQPDLVVVFGDVDATMAVCIAAKRLGYPVAHVEAGLRSFDRRMPEELNRLVVDAIADIFFTTSFDASEQLVSEGHSKECIHFVGNLMIDSLVRSLDRQGGRDVLAGLGLDPGLFGVATFHRPSNVDDRDSLEDIIRLLAQAASKIPMLLPLHPRTAAALDRHGLRSTIEGIDGLRLVPAIRYQQFASVVSLARFVLTDSGGIQEETSFLGIPCMTYRENTERPITITHGTNRLVKKEEVLPAIEELLKAPGTPATGRIPLWDGRAAERIAARLHAWWTA
ncbi:non-hydrolyzing UDP-N-acetylglucosamine 2-epimerase [Luteimonas sp. A277]